MGVIQPSLRDLTIHRPEPGSELPGYFQISLREMTSADPICTGACFLTRRRVYNAPDQKPTRRAASRLPQRLLSSEAEIGLLACEPFELCLS